MLKSEANHLRVRVEKTLTEGQAPHLSPPQSSLAAPIAPPPPISSGIPLPLGFRRRRGRTPFVLSVSDLEIWCHWEAKKFATSSCPWDRFFYCKRKYRSSLMPVRYCLHTCRDKEHLAPLSQSGSRAGFLLSYKKILLPRIAEDHPLPCRRRT